MPLFNLTSTEQAVDIQKTTLSVDVLSRFICNTWEESTADAEGIDVVVLGSGMYGGYCASKIYTLSQERFDRPLRVLILEAGPFLLSEHGQNIPNLNLYGPSEIDVNSGANPGVRNTVWGVGWRSNQKFVGQAYCVGGKSIYWGGWCPRLQPEDLQKWPKDVSDYLTKVSQTNPIGRRPITHVLKDGERLFQKGDPLSAYETVEYEIGVKPTDDFIFDPVNLVEESKMKAENGTLQNDKIQAGLNETLLFFLRSRSAQISNEITEILPAPLAIQTQSFISGLFSLDKYSSVPAIISCARDDHGNAKSNDLRMSIVPNAHVVKLECAESSESAVGTRLVKRIIVKVNGQEKVLTISPFCQVVLAMSCIESTRLALESFSLESSLLRPPGQELMGRNFMIHLRREIAFKIDRKKFADFVEQVWPTKRLADVLQQASMHIQCKGKHGTYQYQLYAAVNKNGPDANLYRMIPDLEIQTKIADGFDEKTISFVLRASGEVIGGKAATIGDPNFDYIDLAGAGDYDQEFNHRRAWVQFKQPDPSHTNDAIWDDIDATARAIARALDGGQLPLDLDIQFKQGVGTTYHDSGTLWMGDDPSTSVTDVNGHFHHVTNAYCADQALFTTVGSANPVLTGLCLARKVADDIVSRHDKLVGMQDGDGLTSTSLDPAAGWISTPYNGMIYLGNETIETRPFPQDNPVKNIGIYYLPEELTDFEMYVEWKAYRGFDFPNSGIILRMTDPSTIDLGNPADFKRFYSSAIEIQIDDLGKNYQEERPIKAIFGDSMYKTGAVYAVKAASQWASKILAPEGNSTSDRYWNTYHIKVLGSDVLVHLNGKNVCQANIAGKNTKGFLGFQFHTGKVQFRNFKLKKNA